MVRDEVDWDAPLGLNGEARREALLAALGVPMPEVRALLAELRDGVSAADWGFGQLVGISDVEQRAVISDQLLSAAEGVQDALTDAGIRSRDVDLHTGPNGIAYPSNDDSLDDMLRGQRLRAAVAGFFDATGTALDCLAAVLIVVARVPLSVQRADYGRLIGLDPEKGFADAFVTTVPAVQRDLWRALVDELAAASAAGPPDWLAWSLEMRNALTHRGRITDIHLPRPISTRILVPPTPSPQRNYRYDLHLRHRPWLPALEQMLAGSELTDSWLDEPAQRTVAGLCDALHALCERLAAWARTAWARDTNADLAAPVRRWVLPAAPSIDFHGVAPGGTTPIAGGIGGVTEQYLRMAERLRRRRAGLEDLGAATGGPA